MSSFFSVAADTYIKKTLDEMQLRSLDEAPPHIRKETLRKAKEMARTDTFGRGHKMKNGEPVEQGLGSWDNPTLQSIEAYIANQTKRQPVPDADYEEQLRKMRARLAEVQAQRRKTEAVAEDELA
jgi:hypothetical protein